jgi:hypothetical protein
MEDLQMASTLKIIRISNVRTAVEHLKLASNALKLAQMQTDHLGKNHSDCADYAAEIDKLLSSDGGEAGLVPLLSKYNAEIIAR